MDQTFFIGTAAFISGLVIFVGSIWLLMTLVMGPKLAYWLAASVTLAFVLVMAAVWSYGDPLGPVGEQARWEEGAIAREGETPAFGPGGYPDSGDWRPPDEDDPEERERATELENAAQDYLTRALEAGEIATFRSGGDAAVDTDSIRIAERADEFYGGVTFRAVEAAEGEEQVVDYVPTVVIMQFDPGYPNRPAHLLLGATVLLFVGHLWGLSRMERRARRAREENNNA